MQKWWTVVGDGTITGFDGWRLLRHVYYGGPQAREASMQSELWRQSGMLSPASDTVLEQSVSVGGSGRKLVISSGSS